MIIPITKETGVRQVSLGVLNGGLFLDTTPDAIPPNGWTDGYDMVVSPRGHAVPRHGRTVVVDLADEFDPLPATKTIYAIGENRDYTQGEFLYVFIGNKCAWYNGATWAWLQEGGDATFAEGRWDFTRVLGFAAATEHQYLACANDEEELMFIDETGTVTRPDTSSISTKIANPYGHQLEPKWGVLYKNRLFISGDTRHPSSLFCSVAGNPNAWDIVLPTGTDMDAQEFKVGFSREEPITGLYVYRGLLFIFKQSSIWYLDGTSGVPSNWTIRQFSGRLGCLSGYTIQDIGNDVVYVSNEMKLRSLAGTEKFGDIDMSAVSAGRIDSYLGMFRYGLSASTVDPVNGWYVLSMSNDPTERADGMVIYDYGRALGVDPRGMPMPGPWYRVAPMRAWSGSAMVQQNGRSCFCRSRALSATPGEEILVSGGYDSKIYSEFTQVAQEDCDDDTTRIVSGWVNGVHITMPDGTKSRIHKLSAVMRFLQAPVGGAENQYAVLGAIIDPIVKGYLRFKQLNPSELLGYAFYWGVSKWDQCKWDVSADRMVEATISERGYTFCVHLAATGLDIEIHQIFVTIEEGAV